jgi:predicted RNA-binding Zn-ribbon protein involved in translation (DUF1610 family)
MATEEPPVRLADAYQSKVTLSCPSTGDGVTVDNPKSPLDFTFDCPSCGEEHHVNARRSSDPM